MTTPSDRLAVFYSLVDGDKVQMAERTARRYLGREQEMYRKLEEKYGAWRFFEVWGAVEAMVGAGVGALMNEWYHVGLEELMVYLENKHDTKFFTRRSLIPLNDRSSQRKQIESLFRQYDPTKPPASIGALLQAYRGHEDALIYLLKLKFEGPSAVPIPPPNFYDMTFPLNPHSPIISPIRDFSTPMLPVGGQVSMTSPPPRLSPAAPEIVEEEDFASVVGGGNGSVVMGGGGSGGAQCQAPSYEEWVSVLEAMQRKDVLIAKQSAALDQQMEALREEKGRKPAAAPAAPPAPAPPAEYYAEQQYYPLFPAPPLPEPTTGEQIDLSHLAKVLEVPVDTIPPSEVSTVSVPALPVREHLELAPQGGLGYYNDFAPLQS